MNPEARQPAFTASVNHLDGRAEVALAGDDAVQARDAVRAGV